MQTCWIPKILFDLIWSSMFGCHSASGWPQIKKWHKTKCS